MPRAPTPARSPPPRPLRRGEMTFRPTHDVGPRTQCISGLNHAAYGLPVNASRPGSPQAHASLGSGWRPTLAGWDWIPTGFRTRFRRSHHVILSPLTGLSRHTRWCTAPRLAEVKEMGRRRFEEGVGLPSAGPGGERLLPVQDDHWGWSSSSGRRRATGRGSPRVHRPESDDRAQSTSILQYWSLRCPLGRIANRVSVESCTNAANHNRRPRP